MVLETLSSLPFVAISVGIITACYFFLTWHFGYWDKQGMKSDRPWPIFGTISNPFSIPFDVQDLKGYKKYGRVFGIYEGRRPALIVGDPELLKIILVKDFNTFPNRRKMELSEKDKMFRSAVSLMRDEEWKNLRNILTPTFTTGKMKQMFQLIENCSKELIKHLRTKVENNENIEVLDCFSALTLDVIATCAFGTKIDCLDNPNSEFITHSKAAFNNPPKTIGLSFFFPMLAKYLPPFIARETTNYFTKLVDDVIAARKQEKNPRKDFLQLMLEAKEESDTRNGSIIDGHDQHFSITDDHIVAQGMIFILAGFETTSTTLSFVSYHLALDEEIQEKLIREIDDNLENTEGALNYNSISEMQYLDMIISETLRMYPPATRLERMCEKDDYDLRGITLQNGFVINVPVYAIHYDEEFYPNPTKFDPERFSYENKNKRNPYTYLPFGYGPRNCLGMRFALMEMKIALICLLKEFRIKTCSETEIPFVRKPSVGFLKPKSMVLKFEKRTDVAI